MRGNGYIYKIECPVCLRFKLGGKSVSCNTHVNNPNWFAIGNPIASDTFRNYMAYIENLTRHECIRKANSLYPIDFYNLGEYLVTSDNPKNLLLWTVIVCGKAGFLREH